MVNLLWDGTNDNPIIEVSMKVKGDQQGGILPGTVQVEPLQPLESSSQKKAVSNSQSMNRVGKKPSKPAKTV